MKNRFVEDSAIDSGTALAVMRRSLRFVWPFRGRITVKLLLLLVGALPGLLLPWPIKVLIDNVIDGRPIADPLVPYPAFIQPFMNLLVDLSITEILWAVIGAQLILLFLSGSFGTAETSRTTPSPDSPKATTPPPGARTKPISVGVFQGACSEFLTTASRCD